MTKPDATLRGLFFSFKINVKSPLPALVFPPFGGQFD